MLLGVVMGGAESCPGKLLGEQLADGRDDQQPAPNHAEHRPIAQIDCDEGTGPVQPSP